MQYFTGEERGNFTGLGSPHTVANGKNTVPEVDMEMIFVPRSDQSLIGFSGDFQA